MQWCVGKISIRSCKNGILLCCSATQSLLPAEAVPLQAKQLPAQGDLEAKPTGAHFKDFHVHELKCADKKPQSRFVGCNVSLLSSVCFHTMGTVHLLDGNATCDSVSPGWNLHTFLKQANSQSTCIQSLCTRPPKATAGFHLCAHVQHLTCPLAMSLTSAQLHQSWIGPCLHSETAIAYSQSSDCYTMKPFTRLINSALCTENNHATWFCDFLRLYHL